MAVSKRTRFEVLRRDDYTCRYCRSRENALTIDERATERRAQDTERLQAFRNIWDGARIGPLPSNWKEAVRGLISSGLTMSDFEYAVEMTPLNSWIKFENYFRYFMGICHRLAKERTDEALRIIGGES